MRIAALICLLSLSVACGGSSDVETKTNAIEQTEATTQPKETAPPIETPPPAEPEPEVPVMTDIIDHAGFDGFLKKFVSETGRVDYKGIKADEAAMKELETYLTAVGGASIEMNADKTAPADPSAALAFYINAYNANVIKSVVEKYPIKSVMKVKGFFKKKTHTVAGTEMTLDALENEIIRKQFTEPRIHFVLVCAANSCPILRPIAATKENVESLMDTAAKEFIPGATTVKKKRVKTSQLFNWFAADFKATDDTVGNYLAKYLPEHAELLKSGKAKISFTKYDWKLNQK